MLHACRLQYARRVGQLPVADRALLALAGRCGRCESQHLTCRFASSFFGVAAVLWLCRPPGTPNSDGSMVNATVTASVSCCNRSHRVSTRQQHHRIPKCCAMHRRTNHVPAIKQAAHIQHAQQSINDTRQSSSNAGDATQASVRLIRCDNVCPPETHRFGCLPQLAVRLVEAFAALVLVGQPLPAMAGEIIQGMPRVADGDTLQVRQH